MKWSDKIKQWEDGNYQTYPQNIHKRFFFETKACDNLLENEYEEKFIEDDDLQKMSQNYCSYKTEIQKSKNRYVTSFDSLSKDGTLLIIPMPRKNKVFTTIKDFCDNASSKQQQEFWKEAAIKIKDKLTTKNKIYVSTHGLGVPYFHLRLANRPKYYKTQFES